MHHRGDAMSTLPFDAVTVLGSSWFLRVLRIGTIIALIAVRRFRHVFAVLLAIILVQVTVEIIQEFVGRPRPFVPIIGDWKGPAHPSGPVARLGVTVAVMAYTLVPAGRRRLLALGVAGSLVFIIPTTISKGLSFQVSAISASTCPAAGL